MGNLTPKTLSASSRNSARCRKSALGVPVGCRSYSTPATYEFEGLQYIVIAAGGGDKPGTKPGDAYYCFARSICHGIQVIGKLARDACVEAHRRIPPATFSLAGTDNHLLLKVAVANLIEPGSSLKGCILRK